MSCLVLFTSTTITRIHSRSTTAATVIFFFPASACTPQVEMWTLRWFLRLGANSIKNIYMPYIFTTCKMCTGLGDTHFPAQLQAWAECKYERYGWKTDRWKTCPAWRWHSLLLLRSLPPPPSSSQAPRLTPLLWLSLDTSAGLCFCECAITIHSLPFAPTRPRLLRVGSPACLASMGTLGELLFASGNLGNLSAACSGLSKTTVAFSCVCTHSHTRTYTHTAAQALPCPLLTPSFCFSIPFFSTPL